MLLPIDTSGGMGRLVTTRPWPGVVKVDDHAQLEQHCQLGPETEPART